MSLYTSPYKVDGWTGDLAGIKDLVDKGRSPTEAIVKSVVIHLACLVAVGHLGSLRRQPMRLLIALSHFRRRHHLFRRGGNEYGWRTDLCAVLGMCVVPSGSDEDAAVSSHAFNPSDALLSKGLEVQPKDRNQLFWAARLILPSVLIAQAVMSSILWIRRIRYWELDVQQPSRPPQSSLDLDTRADSILDHLNAQIIIGGLVVGILSLTITALNCSWECPQRTADRIRIAQEARGKTWHDFPLAVELVVFASILQIPAGYRVIELIVVPTPFDIYTNTFSGKIHGPSTMLLWTMSLSFTLVCCVFASVMSSISIFGVTLPRRLKSIRLVWGSESILIFTGIGLAVFRLSFIVLPLLDMRD